MQEFCPSHWRCRHAICDVASSSREGTRAIEPDEPSAESQKRAEGPPVLVLLIDEEACFGDNDDAGNTDAGAGR
jgi:hypothetical protein